jgi:hypothetical protein
MCFFACKGQGLAPKATCMFLLVALASDPLKSNLDVAF